MSLTDAEIAFYQANLLLTDAQIAKLTLSDLRYQFYLEGVLGGGGGGGGGLTLAEVTEAAQDVLGTNLVPGSANVTVAYNDTSGNTTINSVGGSSGVRYSPPAPIGTLYGWHRTSLIDGSNNYLADGTTLASIAPQVGAVPLAASGAAGTRPTVTTINGRKHFVVDGIDDVIDAAVGQIAQPFGMLMVGQYMGPIDTLATRRYMISQNAPAGYRAAYFQPSGSNYLRAYAGGGSNMNMSSLVADNSRHMFFACFNDASSVAGRDLSRVGYFNVSTLWAATTAYTVGTERYVTGTNRVYRCIAAGTSAGTAPTGTTDSVTDGTVTWKYLGIRGSASPGTEGLDGLRLGANAGLTEWTNVAYEAIYIGTFTADDVEAWYRDLDVASYYGW